MGQRCRYRCGRDNKFDLRVLDSGPSRNLKGLKDISLILCDWCGEESLVGCVWRCVHCLDYYLCNHCYHNDRHSTRHPFFRIDVKNRVRLCSRHESRKVTLSGIFPESHVVRGTDWRWGNQDGGPGTVGKVTTIKGWQTESLRSVAVVQWGEKMTSNVYRLGHRGKVDLKCVEPTTGGSCYPDHLPVIGLYYVDKVGAIPSSELQLSAGDVVKVDLDIEVLKLMQADHGGWNDSMATIRGCAGVINYIHCDGDPEVRYNVGQIYKFNIDAVSKVDDVEVYFIGDVVRVNEDMNLVHSLQTEGPGWVDDLALTLGQVGIVTKLTVMTCVQVRVNGKRWVYDPRCLTRVSPDLLPENNDVEDVDMNARSQMLATMQSVSKEDLLVMAAGAGDATTVRQCLRQHPEQVNRMVDGRTALHEACKEGYPAVVEVLLEYSPDMECMDCNGIRPVQSCAYSNSGKTMSLLLQCGADVNSKGANESSALMVAATLGHNTVLSVMLAHPFLNIQAGGPIGNTALQCATAARRSETVRLLLEAGADPSIADYTASTPLHQAVGMGHFQIVEKMLMYYPDYINLKKDDDGYSLIHVAAANSQLEMLSLLLQQRSCEINSRASADLTALHIAAHEGHTALIELLVGYGADLNATVEKGNTALHLILAKQSMKPLDENTPYTLEVAGKLRTVFGERHFAPYTIVICMLLLEGADLYHKDSMGDSPLVLCPPEITDVLRNVVELCGRGKYHGSLRKSSVTLPKLNKKTATVVAASGAGDVGHKKFPSKELEKSPRRESEMSPPPKRESEMSPLPDDYENKSQTQDKERDLKALVKQPESGSTPTEEASGEDRLCCMCDKEFDVRLQPCGHTVLCLDCSTMAKRCPTCNVPIASREPLS